VSLAFSDGNADAILIVQSEDHYLYTEPVPAIALAELLQPTFH
jgi:hypothetical protein